MRLRELRGGMRRIGETCTAEQTLMRYKDVATQEYDRMAAESGGAVAFPSEWRPLLRSDRLLGLPPADRQRYGCSPAIEDIITQIRRIRAFFAPRERQAPIARLATEHRDPRRARRQPGGKAPQKGCDDIVTLGRAVARVAHASGSKMADAASGCRMPETA
jgi:hypothetical protein